MMFKKAFAQGSHKKVIISGPATKKKTYFLKFEKNIPKKKMASMIYLYPLH